MNCTILKEIRHNLYRCFSRAADALFNTVDALVTETQAQTFPELSLSPLFERQWPSLYEAFEDGRIEHERLRQVFSKYGPLPLPGKRVWWGLMPVAFSVQSPQQRETAVWCMFPICQEPPNRSALDGSFRRWSCCQNSQAVGRICWINNGLRRSKRVLR